MSKLKVVQVYLAPAKAPSFSSVWANLLRHTAIRRQLVDREFQVTSQSEPSFDKAVHKVYN